MAPKSSKIPVIAEKHYSKSIWCSEFLAGMGKHNYTLISLDDAEKHEENSVMVIIGSGNLFFKKAVSVCRNHKLHPMVIGAESANFESGISTIKTNRKAAVASLVHYCHSHGRKKTALLGISRHSSTDIEKINAFIETTSATDKNKVTDNIYYNEGNIRRCFDRFFEQISLYDSVLCANDYFAAALITEAAKRGIRVPEDIFVTGYGNSFISRKIMPSITTVAPKYREMGIQAEKIYHHLTENPDITSLELQVGYDIIVRESTQYLEFCSNYIPEVNINEPTINSMFEDEYIKPFIGLDAIASSADASLIQILDGIAAGESYSSIAERLYLSDSAFRYKLNKIFSLTNTNSKNELKQLRQNIKLKED